VNAYSMAEQDEQPSDALQKQDVLTTATNK